MIASAGEIQPTPQIRMIADIPYRAVGDRSTARCALDLHLPAGVLKPALVIWMHGGSMTSGDKADEFNRKIGAGLCRLGFAVAMVNYRLSPGAKFPAYVEDAAAAVRWAVKNAESHGIDASRIYLAGHSAGGYLALLAALDLQFFGKDKAIKGIISISGQTVTHTTVLGERGAVGGAIVVDEAAPLYHAHSTPLRILLLAADQDVPGRVEENQLLEATLRKLGSKHVVFKIIPDRDHMSILERGIDPADPVAKLLQEWIAAE